jgi:chorismate mutase
MSIEQERVKIDAIDTELVELLNRRASVVLEIGRLKRDSRQPIVELKREHAIFERTARVNQGPLSDGDLHHIFERIIDVMRNIQGREIATGQELPSMPVADPGETND